MEGSSIKEFINKCIVWLSSDPLVALSTLLGILSFIASIYAAVKASKIDKTLNKFKNLLSFSKEQPAILKKLQGFIDVINSQNMSQAFIPDVVCVISSINNKYKSVVALKTRIKLIFLLHYLKKPYLEIDFYKLLLMISDLKGVLEKKEG